MRVSGISIAVLVVAAFAIVGCGDDSGPTSASPAPTSFSAAPAVTSVSTASSGLSTTASASEGNLGPNTFNCADVQNVRVRLSKPGFVVGPIVGLYLEYEGILVRGDKIVEVTWDEKNKPGEVERFNVGEGDPQRETDARFDLKGLIAWFYDDLEAPEERQIRVNLRVEGRDGQCARVRRVNVEPGPSLDIGPRGGGNRGESGVALSANVSTPSGSRARFTASASAKNVSSEPVEGPIRTAFVTPPGFSVASSCRSGSSGGGVVICNMGVDRGSALQPGRETEKVSVVFESRDIGGVTTFGAIGLLQDGLVGEVFEYVVDTGAALGVTNLRDLAR